MLRGFFFRFLETILLPASVKLNAGWARLALDVQRDDGSVRFRELERGADVQWFPGQTRSVWARHS